MVMVFSKSNNVTYGKFLSEISHLNSDFFHLNSDVFLFQSDVSHYKNGFLGAQSDTSHYYSETVCHLKWPHLLKKIVRITKNTHKHGHFYSEKCHFYSENGKKSPLLVTLNSENGKKSPLFVTLNSELFFSIFRLNQQFLCCKYLNYKMVSNISMQAVNDYVAKLMGDVAKLVAFKLGHIKCQINKMVRAFLKICGQVGVFKLGHINCFIYLAFTRMCPGGFLFLLYFVREKKINKKKNKKNIYIKTCQIWQKTWPHLVSLYKSNENVAKYEY